MEAITVSMTSEQLSFLVKNYLSTSPKESLHELGMFLCKNSRHQNVYGVAHYLVLAVAKNF